MAGRGEEETLEYIEYTADLDGWQCPITSQLVAAPLFRVALTPTKTNGLKKPSQVMVDKVFSIRRENIGSEIGTLDRESMLQIDQALRSWLQL